MTVIARKKISSDCGRSMQGGYNMFLQEVTHAHFECR
jgi:hypothetical protein